MIIVVDYGIGNLGALINMLEFLGFECTTSRAAHDIERAEKLILPGVGAFDRAMLNLRRFGLVAPLEEAVLGRRTPVLGVCLGMQLLGSGSEEGSEAGLGWLNATTVRINPPPGSGLKVPHIGWSEISPRNGSPLFAGSAVDPRFYFVHSYHVRCAQPQDVAALVVYGEELCCAVSARNVHGVQFHPEKSHRHGMALLRSFAESA